MSKDELLQSISKEVRDLDKIRQLKLREINLELEPKYEDIKSRCPHSYQSKLSERLFGWITVYRCYYCNHTLSEEEYL